MQQQQALQVYAQQNKGTLVPGQTISVNKYTVQVERYLSQGGFSHVYLVRTPTPVYNTTHHVLKRIGVPNEAMLAEVKKEVDIMRILKGHPNVVHLIDAAWHKMATGMYEVFILMEFCPGGGIIDMMNRRLRERLTEAEILQIFVDVCEGVAAMHNLRPALLHRDLKVENILQASNNVFKLCDFGSATPVAPRPPSTTAEVRALEADLNRHTTLQYRAPEMVDPYLRRSVDEKSDVWALGVLLYKLCYYTTPFEEHGPLAILNVQYRIPPYPVYSSQMNTLIASMLREHGTQRPTVFELLAQVHTVRGTKSRFTYDIPPPPPLSPRALQLSSTNALDNLVSYRRAPGTDPATQQAPPAQPQDISTGVQARDRVLEAIAPMRRGRPYYSQQQSDTSTPSSTSRPPSPPKLPKRPDASFGAEEDKAWKEMKSSPTVLAAAGIRAHKSGGVTASVWKPKVSAPPLDDAWSVETRASKAISDDPPTPGVTAFGDNFGEKLWSAFDGAKAGGTTVVTGMGSSSSSGKERISKLAPPPEGSRNTRLVVTKSKDAFDGLGFTPPSASTPTLGEARKLRTGLVAANGNNRAVITPSPSISVAKPSLAPIKPTSSPRPPAQLTTANAAWRSSPSMQPPPSIPSSLPERGEVSAEARFPSVEELDATFGGSAPPVGHPSWQLESSEHHKEREKVIDLSEPFFAPSSSLQPTSQRAAPSTTLGSRSEHVTGVAMRDSEKDKFQRSVGLGNGIGENTPSPKPASYRPISRPSLSRRHRSSIAVKAIPQAQLIDDVGTQDLATPAPVSRKPKDWLTGDIDALISPIKDGSFAQAQASNLPPTPVLREFTNKRSSFIEENTTTIQSPQEAVTAQQPPHRVKTPPSPSKTHARGTSVRERKQSAPVTPKKPRELPVVAPKPVIAALALKPDLESRQGVTSQPSKRPSQDDSDRWRAIPISESPKPTKIHDSSSDGEEEPEDAVGWGKLVEKTGSSRRRKTRGRQSSVHDLVDLWGGGVVQTKERPKDSIHSPAVAAFSDPTREIGVKLQKSRSIAVSSMARPRPVSPRMQSQPSELNASQRRSPSRSPKRPLPHTKQASAANTPSSGNTPVSSFRARPQSMLAFPMSKSTSDGKTDTPSNPTGLSVPEDNSRKHGARRTSITDMVQRFEAIGGKVRGPGPGSGPPVMTPKSTGLKMPTSSTGIGRAVDVTGTSPSSPLVSRFTASRVITPAPEESGPGVDSGKPRPSAIDLARAALAGQDQSKADMNLRNSVVGLPSGTPSRFTSGSSRTGPLDGLSVSLPFSSPKPSTPLEEPRSPSPDKPYQGVGKLIDQWQRKTEVDSPRAPIPRRGDFTPKRAGLVSGEVGKDS
ncbi:uncharacterized protein BJ212DRAFT_1443739 [Suillus subaureus]|uniref:non-specific serine/threonine protein kinase n=1 Tax=Suillus subaureus TaxID=48587 RepID=A0A9P7EN54_9AGAM|nr:uncharacterized protein BJ212DRAFT_1443739 [Suillus subaureus]KAG1825667.1 hypothetical protein BJ212DRAFT_1443739 [Suillus subaureus]